MKQQRTALSRSDEWETERELYNRLCKQYGFKPTIDLSANEFNTKCFHYFSQLDNALTKEWNTCSCQSPPKEDINNDRWLNCPHSKTKAFVLKAHEQWLKHNINIMMLVPCGVISRKYFREIWEKFVVTGHGVEVHPIDRPSFIHPDQKERMHARQDYIVIIWRARA